MSKTLNTSIGVERFAHAINELGKVCVTQAIGIVTSLSVSQALDFLITHGDELVLVCLVVFSKCTQQSHKGNESFQ